MTLSSDQFEEEVEEVTNKLEAPYLTKVQPKLIVKPAGSNVMLPCLVKGNPPANMTWLKNGQPPTRLLGKSVSVLSLTLTRNATAPRVHSPFLHGMCHEHAQVTYKKYKLTMDDVMVSDAGNYTCIAFNSQGNISYTYMVEVKGAKWPPSR